MTEGTVLEEKGMDEYKKGLWGRSYGLLEAYIAQCFNDTKEVHFAQSMYMTVTVKNYFTNWHKLVGF